jgi:hypothetical protein
MTATGNIGLHKDGSKLPTDLMLKILNPRKMAGSCGSINTACQQNFLSMLFNGLMLIRALFAATVIQT